MRPITLGNADLDLSTLVLLGCAGSRVTLGPKARKAVDRSRAVVDRAVASGATMYGINTGFGKLAHVRIERDKLALLQRNLLLSHATGVGDPLPVDSSRLAFALRIHNLAMGYSGVRLELLDRMVALFNADLVPVIPSQGSVGASGDLAPLAHMALPLIGHGEVHHGAKVLSGAQALKRLGVGPIELEEKEGSRSSTAPRS